MLESLGIFIHFGNAIWNLVRAANKKSINTLQLLNGLLGLISLIALLVGLILMTRNRNFGTEYIVIVAIIAMFIVAAADYFIGPLSSNNQNNTDSADADKNADTD